MKNTALASFLNYIDKAYNSTGSWLEREVIFAFGAGVCGAYYKLDLPLSEHQTMYMARRFFEIYFNNLNTPHYQTSFNFPVLKKEMFDFLLPLDSSETLSLNDVSLGIADQELESLANATFMEVVLESLQDSLISFYKDFSGYQPIS